MDIINACETTGPDTGNMVEKKQLNVYSLANDICKRLKIESKNGCNIPDAIRNNNTIPNVLL